MSELPRYNVLLVDDHTPNIIAAGALIDALGYTKMIAENGLDAIAKFTTATFDVVLMDLRMPDLTGVETSKKIRAIEKEKHIARTPIVAMTAYIANSDMKECMDADMDDILPKPIHTEYFSVMIHKFCKKNTMAVSA